MNIAQYPITQYQYRSNPSDKWYLLPVCGVVVFQELKEQELMEEQRRRQMEEENYRLEREAEERERQRRLDEHRDIQKKVAKERIEQLKSTTLGARALATYSEEVW